LPVAPVSSKPLTPDRRTGATLGWVESTLKADIPIKPSMLWRPSRAELIEPCLPSPAKAPPSGPGWIHEIKHDGFRILARRNSAGVRLITRAGNDFSQRFPFITMAIGKLPVRSCLIDGEGIVCDENGLADFERIRRHGALASAVHCAFDLLELDGIQIHCAETAIAIRQAVWYRFCMFRRLKA
jgi:ATP-dependent DNA ligase